MQTSIVMYQCLHPRYQREGATPDESYVLFLEKQIPPRFEDSKVSNATTVDTFDLIEL